VVSPVGELLAMVDAHVAELGHVEHVVGLETVAIDYSIGLYARPDDREERFRSNVWDDHRMDLAAPLEQSEHGNLAASAYLDAHATPQLCGGMASVIKIHHTLDFDSRKGFVEKSSRQR
jgi:hypothetical protein